MSIYLMSSEGAKKNAGLQIHKDAKDYQGFGGFFILLILNNPTHPCKSHIFSKKVGISLP